VNGDGLTTDSATRNLTVDTTPPDSFGLLPRRRGDRHLCHPNIVLAGVG
jgi:hypothetical protein